MSSGSFQNTITGTVLLLMLHTSPAWCAEEPAEVWTFERAAQQAIATHPAILSQQSSSQAATADLGAAKWQRYPTPSLTATKQLSGESNTVLTLQQPLWTAGRISAYINGARSRLDTSEAVLKEIKRDIILNLITAYTEALRLQARQEYAVSKVREHKRLLQLVTRRVEHEVTPPVDRSLAQSRLYQAINELSSITQDLSNAMMQLSQLTGAQTGIEKIAPLQGDTPELPRNKEEAQKLALENSATLARLDFEVAAADADIRAKKSVYLPQLALTYEKTYGAYIPGSFPAGERTLLVMNFQPGAGLSSLSGVDSATAKRQAARLNRDSAVRDLQMNISSDWNLLVAARLRFDNATLSSKISNEVYESYVRQYSTGRKGWLEVLNSAQESALADMTLADASAQITRSALRLRLLTGNLKFSTATP